MTASATIDRAVGEYVGRCVEYVRDLPIEARDEILEDIRHLVSEVSSELDGDPFDLLGPPDRFIAELRGAAGLSSTVAAPKSRRPRAQLAADLGRRLLPHARSVMAWVRRLAEELRPAGWVLRGYALAALLIYGSSDLTEATWVFGVFPVPIMFGSPVLGSLLTLGGIVASVEIGRRRPKGWGRIVVIVAGVLAAIGLVATTVELRDVTLYGRSAEVAHADTPVGVGSPGVFVETPGGEAIALTSVDEAQWAWNEFALDAGSLRAFIGGEWRSYLTEASFLGDVERMGLE